MSFDLPGPGVEWRITPLPNGGHTRTVTTFLRNRRGGYTVAAVETNNVPHDSGEAYRNAGGGFGGAAVAGLKRQKHGDDDAVSGQAKRRRHQRGTGHESTTDEEVSAAACAICLDDFEAGDGLAVMPCAHRFHEGCLTEWLALSRLCPCCHHALPSEGKAPPAVSSLAVATAKATTSAAEGGDAGANQGFQGRAREAATRRSTRARQANVRLFGPEWTADTSDDGLGLQQ